MANEPPLRRSPAGPKSKGLRGLRSKLPRSTTTPVLGAYMHSPLDGALMTGPGVGPFALALTPRTPLAQRSPSINTNSSNNSTTVPSTPKEWHGKRHINFLGAFKKKAGLFSPLPSPDQLSPKAARLLGVKADEPGNPNKGNGYSHVADLEAKVGDNKQAYGERSFHWLGPEREEAAESPGRERELAAPLFTAFGVGVSKKEEQLNGKALKVLDILPSLPVKPLTQAKSDSFLPLQGKNDSRHHRHNTLAADHLRPFVQQTHIMEDNSYSDIEKASPKKRRSLGRAQVLRKRSSKAKIIRKKIKGAPLYPITEASTSDTSNMPSGDDGTELRLISEYAASSTGTNTQKSISGSNASRPKMDLDFEDSQPIRASYYEEDISADVAQPPFDHRQCASPCQPSAQHEMVQVQSPLQHLESNYLNEQVERLERNVLKYRSMCHLPTPITSQAEKDHIASTENLEDMVHDMNLEDEMEIASDTEDILIDEETDICVAQEVSVRFFPKGSVKLVNIPGPSKKNANRAPQTNRSQVKPAKLTSEYGGAVDTPSLTLQIPEKAAMHYRSSQYEIRGEKKPKLPKSVSLNLVKGWIASSVPNADRPVSGIDNDVLADRNLDVAPHPPPKDQHNYHCINQNYVFRHINCRHLPNYTDTGVLQSKPYLQPPTEVKQNGNTPIYCESCVQCNNGTGEAMWECEVEQCGFVVCTSCATKIQSEYDKTEVENPLPSSPYLLQTIQKV
ncbi:hypothetical protein B0J11DRAFT_589203 [Dendryphion nanum]|uniref:Uncharacterized protein n=1 Tax=Dendryphion nanum TaxID=256645 RepID=A0A9P9IXJ5_9PLEO|nr:hypothetical protein B0J11DRAFT_589203 [Dendryphion nanum]